VNLNPTLSVVRSSTIAGPNFVADSNGDGLPDVAGNAPVAPGANVSKVRVALGTGGAGFHTEIDTTFDGYVMGVGDVNGDGKLDLLVASFGKADDFLAVLPGNGDGTFAAFKFVAFTSGPRWAQVADMNGDGKADMVATTADGADTVMGLMYTAGFVYVFNGHGDGTFAAPAVRPVAPGAYRVVVGDFTRDGVMDIATANFSTILYDDCGRS